MFINIFGNNTFLLYLLLPIVDTPECSQPGKGGCSQVCNEVPGSYYCSCLPGYVLAADNKTCTGKAQSLPIRNLYCLALFHTFLPVFLHLIPPLFSSLSSPLPSVVPFSIRTWCSYLFSDYPECDYDNGDCDQICVEKPGSYECKCETGYRLKPNGKECEGEREIQPTFELLIPLLTPNVSVIFHGICDSQCY